VLGGKKQITLEGVLNVMVAGNGKELVYVNFYVLKKFITLTRVKGFIFMWEKSDAMTI
jgi:hypothetical protein